ncbi:MAG: hypothetical protein J2P32_10705 [Actinobacteria bacterium]|nr:hypothetical protein [Actinomycetota bacterium]
MAPREEELARLKRSGALHRIRHESERALSLLQVIVAAGGLIVVVLLSIPWLDGPLRKAGFTRPGPLSQAILTLVVVSIFFEVRRLAARKPASQRRHFSDPIDVYPVLLEHVQAIGRKEEKVLDVLGLTLYTAWPSIRFWLVRPELNGWTMRFTAIAAGSGELSAHLPGSSVRDAQANLDSIVDYADSDGGAGKNVTLKAFCYDFMPSLHGYRLGNGDLFYSILHWRPDGKLSLDDFSYEFVPRDDHSKSADSIREIFDSWFRRATVTEWRRSGRQ